MVDAIFDVFSPLRWCMFAEPVHFYRGAPVKLQAVLANEDILAPGEYPVRVEVFGPNNERVLQRRLTVNIPHRKGGKPPMAIPVFSETVPADWPSGKYRVIATFERDAAAAGRAAEFYVGDRAELPPVNADVALWGDDADLAKWLVNCGAHVREFTPKTQSTRELILVAKKSTTQADSAAFQALARHLARGSTAIFLTPTVFAKDQQRAAWLPLANKGNVIDLPSCIYHNDEWTKRHPIFDGLPCGGLMDYTFYREIISNQAFSGQETPAEVVAGGIAAYPAYSSGLFVTVNHLGSGQFILNTLRIRDNLGKHPAADRLLVNMLRYAARSLDKPLTDLSADFDQQLKAMGY